MLTDLEKFITDPLDAHQQSLQGIALPWIPSRLYAEAGLHVNAWTDRQSADSCQKLLAPFFAKHLHMCPPPLHTGKQSLHLLLLLLVCLTVLEVC